MPYPSRLLKSATTPATNVPVPPSTGSIDSDFVVILAALLCALICVLGLVAVARCAWLRRLSGARSSSSAAANRGLKKKVLHSLPKLVFSADLAPKLADADCPICLSEFAAGDEIRVLPQCGHGFHLLCIDTWLGSHSSCPSCRQILASARCDKCGSLPPPESSSPAAPVRDRDLEAGATSAGATTFLP